MLTADERSRLVYLEGLGRRSMRAEGGWTCGGCGKVKPERGLCDDCKAERQAIIQTANERMSKRRP